MDAELAAVAAVERVKTRTLPFEELMRIHERPLLRLAYRLTGNMEDAKDVAQEVFLRLHRSLHRLDSERDLGPWLYRVAVNCANDVLRARRLGEAVTDDVPAEGSPEQSASAAELVTRALAMLPPKERAALVMREVTGLSTAEVAEALGSTETTVRSQISIARGKLRRVLEGWMGGKR